MTDYTVIPPRIAAWELRCRLVDGSEIGAEGAGPFDYEKLSSVLQAATQSMRAHAQDRVREVLK